MAEEKQEIIDVNSIREKLEDVNALIKPYQLAYVSPSDDCVHLEYNAHFMDKCVLDRLTENVAQDGFLSQLPFCMKRNEDGKYLILSGNHRVKAAVKAHLEYILILYIDEVDKDTQLGYQLSHNALVGRDDQQMLKDLYGQINSIEARKFTGLNELNFVDVRNIQTPAIGPGDIDMTEMKFLFVESRSNDVKRVMNTLEKMDLKEDTFISAVPFEQFIRVMTAVKAKFDIKSKSVAFLHMIRICEKYLEGLDSENKKEV